MRAVTSRGLVLAFGAILLGGKAYAGTQDTPGQACRPTSGFAVNYDSNGVRNDSQTQPQVACPVVLAPGTGRVLFIGGDDNNSSQDFTCFADGESVSGNAIQMPRITVTTGTFTNGTIGVLSIPDDVVFLKIFCFIPKAATFVSRIGDLFVEN